MNADFQEAEQLMHRFETAEAITNRREVRVRWKNGMCLEGYMGPFAAARFAEDALRSPLVASVWLGSEL